MTTSTKTDALEKVIAQLLNVAVKTMEPVGGGRNSRVFKVLAGDGCLYAAKQYYGKTIEGYDRLKRETKGLRFLWDHGERAIAKPIAEDAMSQVALFDFIEGKPISSVTQKDLDQLVNFLQRLDRLSAHPDSLGLPNASEACFSLSTVIGHIEKRLERFDAIASGSREQKELHNFLHSRFRPALDTFLVSAKKTAENSGIDFSRPIATHEQILSPSDLGFHNALREDTSHGRIVFLDFEYFGWDDPAKMIADLLLHPGSKLTLDNKKEFLGAIFQSMTKTRPHLQGRVTTLYKLIGLKWITIVLNEFVGSDMARRKFAVGDNAAQAWKDESQIKRLQLGQAEDLLEKLYNEKDETMYMLRS